MRKLLFVTLLIATLSLPADCGAQTVPQASVRPLVAQITPDMGAEAVSFSTICTTSSINSRIGLWITANHCLAHGPVWVQQPGPVYHAASIVWTDADSDLGIILTPSLQVVALRLAHDSPVVGQLLHLMGFPLGFPTLIHTWGPVSAVDVHVAFQGIDYHHKLMVDMAICRGHSGSPILNEAGELVSIAQIGPGDPCASLAGGATFDALRTLTARFFE